MTYQLLMLWLDINLAFVALKANRAPSRLSANES